jgi:arsenite-transporting ATPase
VRVILFTGKGGVGKTTAAAGTAASAAAHGQRTLVLSTDAAHSLADAFGVPIGAEPTKVADRLFVQQVDAQQRFEQSWVEIQGYLLSVLDASGVDPITAEELTVIPGAEEVLALLELRTQVLSGKWDVVVVDCAPTAETLRLLALPEALGWYMDRVFPAERRIVKALRPVLARAAGVPMPQDSVFDAVERLHRDLEEVHALLTGDDASVRLVLTPEQVVVAEARRSFTTLSLFGYRVDGVLANRVFPAEGADDWRLQWVAAQAEVLAEVESSFTGLPVWRSSYQPTEPVGATALVEFARAAYGGHDPLAPPVGRPPMSVSRTRTGAVLRIALPFVAKSDIDLARHGDELVVTVGSYRRLIALPAALGKHAVSGARIDDGELRVRFTAVDRAAGSADRSGERAGGDR